MMLDDRVE